MPSPRKKRDREVPPGEFFGLLWSTRCTCGHIMAEHKLDWEHDPEVDCYEMGCECPEFTPAGGEASHP